MKADLWTTRHHYTDSLRPAVMTYSDDIVGLGHFRRNSNIATELVRAIPDASVLMMTGLPTGCFFDMPRGVDIMKLPSVDKVDTGRYRPRMSNLSVEIARDIRASTIERTAEIFAPDLLLVDHMPAGVWGELIPTLERLKRRANPPKIVLGLRDVLDAPSVTKRLWRTNGVYELIERYYDAVLVYGADDVVDTRLLYELGDHLNTRIEYCGYLCTPRGAPRELAPHRPRDEGPLIVATPGGGLDGFPLLAAAIRAMGILAPDTSVRMRCIAGPFMASDERRELERLAHGLPVEVLKHASDNTAHIEVADVVVSMAGYNTLLEAIQLGKRIVAVPRMGPSAEQSIRARIFAERGLVSSLPSDTLTPGSLAEHIVAALQAGPPSAPALRFDGLANATRVIRELLTERRSEVLTSPAISCVRGAL